MLLFDSPSFTIFHKQEQNWLHVELRGTHTPRLVEENCNLLLAAVRSTHSQKVLNDSTELLDGWAPTTPWLGQTFYPRLVEEGITSMAVLNAMDWPGRLCIQAMLRHTQQPTVQLFEFDEMTTAQQWLYTN
ncbi:hypothetical protein MUN84_03420 [Hymenobacter sp. 5516J-16]|uniref:hypothetical protein n=1 Tax=Hymenobacter sp. 5516J-16 TaxID=2932253 RepID=UPI001FD0912D|nr:hypothetical protein [Hymenobacter sp. 5516J-16]UOQ77732.1 hypothetical protein MUN84_03420 [Hymenobacter sp. 5516J-16]